MDSPFRVGVLSCCLGAVGFDFQELLGLLLSSSTSQLGGDENAFVSFLSLVLVIFYYSLGDILRILLCKLFAKF